MTGRQSLQAVRSQAEPAERDEEDNSSASKKRGELAILRKKRGFVEARLPNGMWQCCKIATTKKGRAGTRDGIGWVQTAKPQAEKWRGAVWRVGQRPATTRFSDRLYFSLRRHLSR
jgi:hypothetical protein